MAKRENIGVPARILNGEVVDIYEDLSSIPTQFRPGDPYVTVYNLADTVQVPSSGCASDFASECTFFQAEDEHGARHVVTVIGDKAVVLRLGVNIISVISEHDRKKYDKEVGIELMSAHKGRNRVQQEDGRASYCVKSKVDGWDRLRVFDQIDLNSCVDLFGTPKWSINVSPDSGCCGHWRYECEVTIGQLPYLVRYVNAGPSGVQVIAIRCRTHYLDRWYDACRRVFSWRDPFVQKLQQLHY